MTTLGTSPYIAAVKTIELLKLVNDVGKDSESMKTLVKPLEDKVVELVNAHLEGQFVVSKEDLQSLLETSMNDYIALPSNAEQETAQNFPDKEEDEYKEEYKNSSKKKALKKKKVNEDDDSDYDDSLDFVPFQAPGMKMADPEVERTRLSAKDTPEIKKAKLEERIKLEKENLENLKKNIQRCDERIPTEKYNLNNKEVDRLKSEREKLIRDAVQQRKLISELTSAIEDVDMQAEREYERKEMQRFTKHLGKIDRC